MRSYSFPLINFYGTSVEKKYQTKPGKDFSSAEKALLSKGDARRQYHLYHAEIRKLCHGNREGSQEIPSLLDAYRSLVSEKYRFPQVYKLVKIILTLFVSMATADRTFSAMKWVKTRLCSSLRSNNLEC
jgi:hypothetical protein